MLTEKSKGISALIATNIFFAISVILIKILKPFFNQLALTFWRQLVVIFVLLIIIIARKKFSLKKFSKELCFYGFMMFFLQPIIFLSALFFTSVANVLFLGALYVIFNIILADFLLGEKFSRKERIITIVGFLGAGIMFIPAIRMSITIMELAGMILSVISTLFYSLFIVYSKKLRAEYTALDLQFWGILTGSVFVLPLFLAFGKPLQIFNVGMKPVVLLLILASIGLFAGFYAFIYGIKHVRISTAGTLLLLESPLAVLMAVFVLGEVPGLWTIIGGIIILIAGGIIVRNENTPT